MDFRQKAQQWIDGNFDPETKRAVKELAEKDPVALEDAFYRNLEFGTGGLRGIMVTASHNPKEYNGYKVFWSDGGQITAPVDKDIIAEVAKISDPSEVLFESKGVKAPIEMMGAAEDEAYLKDILSLALSPEACARHRDIKFVYTPLHGCGVKLVPECLKRLGFENVYHIPEQDVPDGNFPTVASPNPEEPAAMKMAIEKADEVGADLYYARLYGLYWTSSLYADLPHHAYYLSFYSDTVGRYATHRYNGFSIRPVWEE